MTRALETHPVLWPVTPSRDQGYVIYKEKKHTDHHENTQIYRDRILGNYFLYVNFYIHHDMPKFVIPVISNKITSEWRKLDCILNNRLIRTRSSMRMKGWDYHKSNVLQKSTRITRSKHSKEIQRYGGKKSRTLPTGKPFFPLLKFESIWPSPFKLITPLKTQHLYFQKSRALVFKLACLVDNKWIMSDVNAVVIESRAIGLNSFTCRRIIPVFPRKHCGTFATKNDSR